MGSRPELWPASLQERKLHLFQRKKRAVPPCCINTQFNPPPPTPFMCQPASCHHQHDSLFKYLQNARPWSDRCWLRRGKAQENNPERKTTQKQNESGLLQPGFSCRKVAVALETAAPLSLVVKECLLGCLKPKIIQHTQHHFQMWGQPTSVRPAHTGMAS